jgi:hypothetical protein
MRTLEGDNYRPYTHQISLGFPVINKLFKPTGSKPLLPAQGKGSRRASLEEPAYYSSYTYLVEIQVMSLAVESVAQDSFRGSGIKIESV